MNGQTKAQEAEELHRRAVRLLEIRSTLQRRMLNDQERIRLIVSELYAIDRELKARKAEPVPV